MDIDIHEINGFIIAILTAILVMFISYLALQVYVVNGISNINNINAK